MIRAAGRAAGREHAQVVEQGDGLGAGQLRAGGVDHRQERAELDAHRGGVTGEDVQDVDRQVRHGRVHREEPFGPGAVGVDLFTGEFHPGLVGSASDPAVDDGPECTDVRFPDRAGLADVSGDGSRQRFEVPLGENRPVAMVHRCEAQRATGAVSVFAFEAGRAVRGVGVNHRGGEDHVRHRADGRVAPVEHDHDLGQHDRRRSHHPPPTHRSEEQGSRRHRDHGCQQPSRAGDRGDRLSQRGHVRPTEALGRTQQVDGSVDDDDATHQGCSPASEPRMASGRPGVVAGTAMMRRAGRFGSWPRASWRSQSCHCSRPLLRSRRRPRSPGPACPTRRSDRRAIRVRGHAPARRWCRSRDRCGRAARRSTSSSSTSLRCASRHDPTSAPVPVARVPAAAARGRRRDRPVGGWRRPPRRRE